MSVQTGGNLQNLFVVCENLKATWQGGAKLRHLIDNGLYRHFTTNVLICADERYANGP